MYKVGDIVQILDRKELEEKSSLTGGIRIRNLSITDSMADYAGTVGTVERIYADDYCYNQRGRFDPTYYEFSLDICSGHWNEEMVAPYDEQKGPVDFDLENLLEVMLGGV